MLSFSLYKEEKVSLQDKIHHYRTAVLGKIQFKWILAIPRALLVAGGY